MHRTPRWVKVFVIVVLVVALLVAAIALVTDGRHGPARHAEAGDRGFATGMDAVDGRSPPARADGAVHPAALDRASDEPRGAAPTTPDAASRSPGGRG